MALQGLLGLAVEEDDPGAVVLEIAVALAGGLGPLLPAHPQLVDGRLRERIAHVPEAADEGVALIVLLEPQERRPLLRADQRRHLLQPRLIARRQIGRDRRLGWRSGEGRERQGEGEDGKAEKVHRGEGTAEQRFWILDFGFWIGLEKG